MLGLRLTSVAVAVLSFVASVSADVDPIVIQVGLLNSRSSIS